MSLIYVQNPNGDLEPVLRTTNGKLLVGTTNRKAWEEAIIDGFTVYDQDDNSLGSATAVTDTGVASFFQAKTEIQAMEEDGTPTAAGWHFIHQGWIVPFEEGLSLYGSLPSLNQNIQGIGVQGPTSIGGTAGRPLALTQGQSISGEPTQVNGWKSSQTPTSYSLVPSDVWDDDSSYAYADAYISWNGDTGQVSAPGVTTSNLIQYPADNSVVVEGV